MLFACKYNNIIYWLKVLFARVLYVLNQFSSKYQYSGFLIVRIISKMFLDTMFIVLIKLPTFIIKI